MRVTQASRKMKLMTTNQPKIVLCELGETGIDNVQSYSPFCLKVHRALGLARLDYTSRHGSPRDVGALNPAHQVPILLVDDEVVNDSTRIVARIDQIATRMGRPSLVPKEPRARAEAWLWEDYADRALNGYLVAARWADDRNWPLVREAYFKGAPWFVRKMIAPQIRRKVVRSLVARDVLRAGHEALWDEHRRVLDVLEARAPLEGFWIGTDAPTVADISIFGQIHGLRTPLTAAQARELSLRPALTDWLDRVDLATFPGRPSVAPSAGASVGLTATRGHDMTAGACPSPTLIRARA
jgi:glutathione S-transferase